jgi:hypothetical protein
MKRTLLLFITGFWLTSQVDGQIPIHDKAIVAQQERMVFKEWDQDKFFPKANRILGIPTNPNWFLTWALHPDYPKLDRRPLSHSGEQTQRLSLAAAMKISSDYYKQHSDTIKNIAAKELARISGSFSSLDPLYQLYYKKELSPLEDIEANAFPNIPVSVKEYMWNNGGYEWYLESMKMLAERYGFAKNLDMERGQRILMYHRLMLEMRTLLSNWNYRLALAGKMLDFREAFEKKEALSINMEYPAAREEEILNEIIKSRIVIQ